MLPAGERSALSTPTSLAESVLPSERGHGNLGSPGYNDPSTQWLNETAAGGEWSRRVRCESPLRIRISDEERSRWLNWTQMPSCARRVTVPPMRRPPPRAVGSGKTTSTRCSGTGHETSRNTPALQNFLVCTLTGWPSPAVSQASARNQIQSSSRSSIASSYKAQNAVSTVTATAACA
jgi:hypothetical protein